VKQELRVDVLAVDPVLSETLSRVNSLLSGKNTGIFREFVLKLSGYSGHIRLNTGNLSLIYLKRWLHKQGIISWISGNLN
jgi:hypothetical protein